MTAEQLIQKYNGCVAIGRGIVRIDGENIEVARRIDGVLTLTKEGRRLAADEAEIIEEAKPKRSRKKAAVQEPTEGLG